MMKKFFLMALATAMLNLNASAQQNNDKGNKSQRQRPDMSQMAEMRANQIANQLSLDDATTTKFTEIYKQYVKDMQAVGTKYHPKKEVKNEGQEQANGEQRQPRQRKALTDKEVEERMLNGMKEKKERIEVQENYYKKFRTILNPKQIQKVYAMGGNQGRKGLKGMGPKGKKGQKGFMAKGGKRGQSHFRNRGGRGPQMNRPRGQRMPQGRPQSNQQNQQTT